MKTTLRTVEWRFRDLKVEYPTMSRMKRIKSPEDAYEVLKPLFPTDNTKEHFIALYLGATNKPIGFDVISVGNLNSAVVHPREVFKGAIVSAANSIIIAHCHPSGEVDPSNEDIKITNVLKDAGKLLDIFVFDHLILSLLPGEEKYTSFTERRLL